MSEPTPTSNAATSDTITNTKDSTQNKMSQQTDLMDINKTNHLKGFSGSTLKIIAIIAMFIDHFSAVVMGDLVHYKIVFISGYKITSDPAYYILMIMRGIGRLAFPIFCFLIVEGFIHTHNKIKYAIRLFIFALISEVPFDLALRHSFIDMGYQNVFFTLFLGLVALILYEKVEDKYKNKRMCSILQFLSIIICCSIGIILRTDYNGFGVLAIVIMYIFRYSHKYQTIASCIVLSIGSPYEVFTLLDLPFISRYNGTRGIRSKYFFYIFYPAHLLLLVGISYLFGLR